MRPRSKRLFFFKAYPGRWRFSLVMLILTELLKIPMHLRRRLFSRTLIESRAILGFVHSHAGIASSDDACMLVAFPFYGNTVKMKLRWNSSDFLVFEQVFIREEYSPLISIKNTVSSIVDVGANIGCTTIYLKAFFPQARIVAIEADPDNFRSLLENIKLSNLQGVTCLPIAIWHTNQKVSLSRSFRDNRDWSVQISENGITKVEAKTLDSLLKTSRQHSVDILKMDIEGAEVKIFNDDVSIESALKKVKDVAIEVHDDSNNIVRNKLIRAGFTIFEQSETLFGQKAQ